MGCVNCEVIVSHDFGLALCNEIFGWSALSGYYLLMS